MNQELEQYLKIYVNYQQDDWSEWLSLAEFTYNNQEHSATKCSPFFANYGRHPNKGTNQNLQVKSQSAIELAEQMRGIHEEVGAAISHAQRLMKTQYDKRRRESRNYQKWDKVWVDGKEIATDRPTKKLDDRRYGPFEVQQKVGEAAYLLWLPATWKGIYPVINEGRLSPYTAPASPLQKQPPPPPAVIVEGQEEYEVATIHGKKWSRNRELYLVEWVGYPNKVDWTWEPRTNLTNAGETLAAFEKQMINESSRTTTIGGGYCYDHVTPRDENTHPFSKEQTRGGAKAPRGSAQERSMIKQVPDKRQNDSLLRQQNNKSLNQEQTPMERKSRRPREGRNRSEYHQTPMTADQRLTAETRTQTTTTRPKAVELRPQTTTT
jgi:hypothetical protein